MTALVDVLGEPAEALPIALPLQHAAHEHLQWSCVQLLHGNVTLDKKKKQGVEITFTGQRGKTREFRHGMVTTLAFTVVSADSENTQDQQGHK